MRYRIGLPFWKLAARAGFPLLLRVNVTHDSDAGVYIAESDDLDGLACEGQNLDDLRQEVLAASAVLLELAVSKKVNQPATDLRMRPA